MTNTRYIYLILAFMAVFMLPGCEKDLNLDRYRNPEMDNMLVVNSITNPDSLIAVSVTHPYFFSEPHLVFSPVTGLDVSVSGNGGEWESLTYDEISGNYVSGHTPKDGEILRLRVEGESQSVTSCDTVPHKIEIEDVTVTRVGPIHIYWDTDYRFTYKITFTDPTDEDNYYFLVVNDDADQYEFSYTCFIDYTADYVFQVLASMLNQDVQGWQPDGIFGYPFSDKGIDGQRYSLTLTEVIQNPWTSMLKRLMRKISLYSISKAYYEYMISVLAMDYEEDAIKGNLLSLGLMEPTKIYSNIEGGAGLMGSYNLSTRRIDILQMTGGWPTE